MGKGIFKDIDGRVYECDWCNGKKNGKGTITLANGDSFEVYW